MKLNSNSLKLLLAGGLATAVIGCSGGAGTSHTTSTNQPSTQTAQQTQNHGGHSSQASDEVASVSEDLDKPEVTAASPAGHMHDMAMGTEGMAALRALNGKDFDIAFMSQMITHHQGAIDMAITAQAL